MKLHSRWLLLLVFTLPLLSRGAEREPGQSYFADEQKYVEYVAGDLPIVISAPHGGREKPDAIPSREQGVVQMDQNTQELARAIAAEFRTQTGHAPHVIICRLHRQKLDCNRELAEAAAGNPVAEKTWGEYHAFIDEAMAAAQRASGRAFYIDLHGHGHKEARLELGYLHSAPLLGKPEAVLNDEATWQAGSLRFIAARRLAPYAELLRGPRSLGALLEAQGFPATPSPAKPVPGLPYFQGGYSVRRHAWTEGAVAGLQIETNFAGVRDTAPNRAKFAAALVKAMREYLAAWFEVKLPARP